jgi:hypothetical protein
MYTRIANDMNNIVALGTSGAGVNKYCCGKHFGRAALPGTDGYCGPDNTVALPGLWPVRYCGPSARRRDADTEYDEEMRKLQKELSLKKKMVRELQAANKTGEKRIRELEAAAGDEWTRLWDDKTVWPVLYKAVARGFHPNASANVGNTNQEKIDAFFIVASDKNNTFNGKGRQSAAEMTAREEEEVVARKEHEAKREKAEAKREKTAYEGRRMTDELLEILASWGLQSKIKASIPISSDNRLECPHCS